MSNMNNLTKNIILTPFNILYKINPKLDLKILFRLKLGYKLNKQIILEAGKFEFENISLSAFSQAFTGDYDRDYTELDKQIYEAVKNSNDSSIETITNNVDGLKETITITQDFLLYKLERKVYNFK